MIKYSEEEVKDSDGGDVYVPKEEVLIIAR